MSEERETSGVLRSAGVALALSLLLIVAGHAAAADPASPEGRPAGAQSEPETDYEKTKGEALDAYIAGRLITAYALSEHLSPYALQVEVTDARVLLGGVVANQVQRDLAIEIARGIEQAREVSSRIKVDPAHVRSAPIAPQPQFAQRFSDAGITARIKSRLLMNGSTDGLAIDVDTRGRNVQLSGEVDSPEESALAEQIAINTRGVKRVQNQLAVAHRAAGSRRSGAAGRAWYRR